MIPLDNATGPEPPRDSKGRYRITRLNDGQTRSFTRATTIAEAIDDRHHLEKWKMRQVARGIGLRADLYALASSHHADDDKRLYDRLCDQALEASKSSAAASTGTALHRFTEQLDRHAITLDDVPEQWRPTCQLYLDTLQDAGIDIDPAGIEQVVIDDRYQVAGTVDRLGLQLPDGRRVVGDLKGLAVDTPIPTPDGWTTMGAIQVGDQVYGRDGRPATVTAKSEIHAKTCYRITFDDTTSIVADHDHRWWVRTSRHGQDVVMTTTELAANLYTRGRRPQRHLQIWNTAPLQAPDADLPIDPYVLGAWLGDGHVKDGSISKPLPELWAEITRRGYDISSERDATAGTRTVYRLRTALRKHNLLWNKHIPDQYLRASERQRRDLLAGLMDTDGSFNTARQECTYYTTSKTLALQVEELILSLGHRATFWEGTRTGFGKTVACYDVKFRPHDQSPFIAKNSKWGDVTANGNRSQRRLITSVEQIPTVPTQCISVDSPDQSYLCGHQMLPTHNTGKSLQWSWLAISIQLAIYAHHTATWTHAGGDRWTRGPRVEVDTITALVIHLPATGPHVGTCRLYYVDLQAGWDAYLTALEVRGHRRDAKKTATLIDPQQRAWLVTRMQAILGHPQAAADLGRCWPPGLARPFPRLPTPDQIDLLAAALDVVEDRHQLAFHGQPTEPTNNHLQGT